MLLLLLRLNEDLVEPGDKESGEFCELSDEPIDDFTIPQNNKTMCPTLFFIENNHIDCLKKNEKEKSINKIM